MSGFSGAYQVPIVTRSVSNDGPSIPELNFTSEEWIGWWRFTENSGSDFTIWVTDDGTETGQPVFRDLSLCLPQIYAQRNTGDDREIPIAYGRGSVDGVGLRVGCFNGNRGGVLLGGSYQGLEPNSSNIAYRILIIGQKHPNYQLPPVEVNTISP